MHKEEKQHYFNYTQVFIDSLTIFFGFCAIICAVITFVDFGKNDPWVVGIFAMAAAMCIMLVIKAFMQGEKTKGILRLIECILLVGLTVLLVI